MRCPTKEAIYYFDGANIKDEYDSCISSYLDDVNLAKTNFEILSEKEEEIDIDSIEEINFYTVNSLINGKFEENIDNEFKKT
jgi:hypothetical protein